MSVEPTVSSSAEPFSERFVPGMMLGDKFELIEVLGSGGVGVVVSARHVGFDDRVALKFLRPEYVADADSVKRFTREAQASFRIRSEHVARVFDLSALPDGTPFIVMELLDGEDLRKVLQRAEKLSHETIVDYGRQICAGLWAAHRLGIIHRDVKPENIFLTKDRDGSARLKLLDFGISKLTLHTSARRTQPTHVALGTPAYMAPEQVRASRDLDQRADVWSLGCVLYELLTGSSPFERSSIMHSCAAVLEEEPAPPGTLRHDLDPKLDEIVMRCLRKEPSARFMNAAELASALEGCRNSGGALQRPILRSRRRLWFAALALGGLGGAFALSALTTCQPRPRLIESPRVAAAEDVSQADPPLLSSAPVEQNVPAAGTGEARPTREEEKSRAKPRPISQPRRVLATTVEPAEPDVGF